MTLRSDTRRGLTLVELLVVIAIIGILAAGLFVVTQSLMSAARHRATDNTMKAAYALLESRWREVIDAAKKEVMPPAVLTAAGNHPERAREYLAKIRLMEAFPTRFSDIKNCYGATPTSHLPTNKRMYNETYKKKLGSVSGTGDITESSACLVMALTASAGTADVSLGESVKDVTGDGLPDLVDGWGKPIVFLRFPTGLAGLPAASNKTLLENTGWTDYNTFTQKVHKLPAGNAILPVLVSGGPNEKLALTPGTPLDNVSGGDTDNRYSFQLGLAP